MQVAPTRTRSAGLVPRLRELPRSYRAPAGLLIAYLATFPLYLSPSGLPQISSVIAAGLFVVLMARHRRLFVASNDLPVLSALAHFVIYAWLVSLVWAVLLTTPAALLPAAYFTYNAALFAALHHLRWGLGERLHHIAVVGILLGLGWQMLYWAQQVRATGFTREVLLFNNPNQLGYYALLCGIILALPASGVVAARWRVAGLAASALLVILSLSSAAMLAFALLLPISVLAHRRNLGVTLAAVTLIVVGVLPNTQEAVTWRLEKSADESVVTHRGYDRLVNHPEQLVFGAGEYGHGQRFESELDLELHSSIATLLFSYGVVGSALFARFVWRLSAGAAGRSWLYLLPIAFYGLTHQGLRFSMAWVAIALLSTSRPRGPTGAPVTSNRLVFEH